MAAAQRIAKIPGHMRALEDQALAEVASGRITPLVNEPFPLAEAAQAHTALENRATVGKVVLKPWGGTNLACPITVHCGHSLIQ